MALTDLTVEAMLMISEAWLDPNGARPMLEAIPTAGAMLPRLERVHNALEGTRSGNAQGGQRLLELVEEATDTDRLHDRKVRGLHHLLTALSELTEDPLDVARYLDLREALLPHGLETADLSYHDEADSAICVEQRLSATQRDLLTRLPLPWGTVMHEVEAWRETGRRLVQIEHRWATLKRKATGGDETADLIHTRHAWVKVVETLRQILEMEEVSAHVLDAILGPLVEAEALATSVANASGEVDALHRSVDEGVLLGGDVAAEDPGVDWIEEEVEVASIEMLYNTPLEMDAAFSMDNEQALSVDELESSGDETSPVG